MMDIEDSNQRDVEVLLIQEAENNFHRNRLVKKDNRINDRYSR